MVRWIAPTLLAALAVLEGARAQESQSTTTTQDVSPTTTLAISATNVPPAILGPDVVYECADNVVAWAGGMPPYRLTFDTEDAVPISFSLVTTQVFGNSFTWFNNDLRRNQTVSISISDDLGLQDTKTFLVHPSSNTTCLDTQRPDTIPFAPDSTTTATDEPSPLALPIGAILTIVFGGALIVGMILFWIQSRRQRKPTPTPDIYTSQAVITSDKSSLYSARSGRSVRSNWSTFSQQKRIDSQSIEDGIRVEIDMFRSTDEAKSPITAPSAAALLDSPRGRQWSSYPLPNAYRAQDKA